MPYIIVLGDCNPYHGVSIAIIYQLKQLSCLTFNFVVMHILFLFLFICVSFKRKHCMFQPMEQHSCYDSVQMYTTLQSIALYLLFSLTLISFTNRSSHFIIIIFFFADLIKRCLRWAQMSTFSLICPRTYIAMAGLEKKQFASTTREIVGER